MLRSFRFGEADRVLHMYTLERGRVGAIAKGVRKTKSRFGGRLEPFSHVELVLHQGRGELETVTGASLVRSHDRARTIRTGCRSGMIGLEAMLRLFTEQEANERAFTALTRFLDALDDVPPRPGVAPGARTGPALVPAQAPLGLRLHAAPAELRRVRGGGRAARRLPPAAGGMVCAACDTGGIPLSAEGFTASGCCCTRRSRTRRLPGSATAPGATRSPSSPPRTSITAASG